MRKFFILSAMLASAVCFARGQVALKSNLLSDAFLSPNIGVEVGLTPKLTFDVSCQLNTCNLSHNRRWKHWILQPELRYWLCQRFAGHFFGVEAHAGQFNVGNIDLNFHLLGTDFGKLKDRRYQGWQGGAGITYGYAWIVSEHWNFEGELGIGYSYTRYDSYPCAKCGTKLESGKNHNYFGVTKAAVNIVYLF